jgi:hypothetical protein
MKLRVLSVVLMAGALGACVTDEGPAYYGGSSYSAPTVYSSPRTVVVEERYYGRGGPRYAPAPVYSDNRYGRPYREDRRDWRRGDDRRGGRDWRDDDRRGDWRNDNRREEGRRPDRRPDARPDVRPSPQPDRGRNQGEVNRRLDELNSRNRGGGLNLRPVPNRNEQPQSRRRGESNEPEVIMAPDARRR